MLDSYIEGGVAYILASFPDPRRRLGPGNEATYIYTQVIKNI